MNTEPRTAKKTYVRLSVAPVRIQIESAILSGSVTECKISIANNGVTVADFTADTGFGDNGTWDISF